MTTLGYERYASRRSRVSEWSVRDFKALEEATLPMKRLNLLVGANSSGKSSLIQSLLLLAQSTDDEIVLNGPLVRLGEPGDVIRSGSDGLSISYSFTPPAEQGSANQRAGDIHVEVSLRPRGGSLVVTDFACASDGGQLLSASASRVSRQIKNELRGQMGHGEQLLRLREVAGRAAPPWTFVAFKGFDPSGLIYRQTRKGVLASLRKSMRTGEFSKDSDTTFAVYRELLDWLQSSRSTENIKKDLSLPRATSPKTALTIFSQLSGAQLDRLLNEYAATLPADRWVRIPIDRYVLHFDLGWSFAAAPIRAEHAEAVAALSLVGDALTRLRNDIRYLGPLREEPQVVSASGPRNRSLPSGSRGEHTADLLARMDSAAVPFHDWIGERRTGSLPEAVSLWTTYLGIGEGVAVKDQGKLGRGLRITVDGVERDLTTIGVGASQVVPVLASVLAADPGAIVLLEQPELHLHPAVQSRLADFFLHARPDVRIVVETHSEYLVTRLRRRVAERVVPPSSVAVLFAEQTNGLSILRRLRLNELGDFSEWPEGFFDSQDLEGRALVKAVQQRLAAEE